MSRDSATVSNNMRKIHSKDTSIELLLRKALWYKGYRYRKNYKALPGSPDIVLTKYKIAIFCDSEFFHGKDWEILKLRLEKGKNPDFWIKKIERNRNRDYENDKKLLFLGYTVLHFWGVTEELKMRDQMEWVRRMNNIKATAEEIVYKNIIFM